jgi:hypothetical protein
MYDPVNGRFLQQDPTGFDAGDLNLYRYVRNNPVNQSDPSGLHPGDRQPPPGVPASPAGDTQDQEVQNHVSRRAGQPHGWRYVVEIHFESPASTNADEDLRKQVLNSIASAAVRIDRALYALENYWPQIQNFAVAQDDIPFLLEANNRQRYITQLRSVFDVLTRRGNIDFCINSTQVDGSNAAYVRTLFSLNVGTTIYLNPNFFQHEGGVRVPDEVRSMTITHEFGRRFPRISAGTAISNWDDVVRVLSDNFAELERRNGRRSGPPPWADGVVERPSPGVPR